MNRNELIARISTITNLNQDDVKTVVCMVFDEIMDAARRDERVVIRGFGRFMGVVQKPREYDCTGIGGAIHRSEAAMRLTFKPSKSQSFGTDD